MNFTNSGMIWEQNGTNWNRSIAFRGSFQSFDNGKQSPTLLSHKWKKNSWQDIEFAYYKDLYINNQENLTNEFIVTTPFRAPQNYYSNGYMILLWGSIMISMSAAGRNSSIVTCIQVKIFPLVPLVFVTSRGHTDHDCIDSLSLWNAIPIRKKRK